MQRATPSRQAETPVSGERSRAEILKLKKQESDPESSPAAPTKRVRWQSFPVEINELASVAEPAGFQVAELPADSDVLPPALACSEGVLTGSPEFLLECGEDEPPRGKQRKALAGSVLPDDSLCAAPHPSQPSVSPEWEQWSQDSLPQDRELRRRIKAKAKSLKLKRNDKNWSAEMVNNLVEKLMEYLKENKEEPYFRDVAKLTTGSYYELVKTNNPDEFDVMLILPTPRIAWTEVCGFSGLFYRVSVCRPPRSPLKDFLLEDGLTISAVRILKDMRNLIKKFMRTYKVSVPGWHWSLERQNPGCPAITLSLLNNKAEVDISLDLVPALEIPSCQGWPEATKKGLKIEDWLGKKSRRAYTSQSFYFVPKKPKGRGLSEEAKESWRISFSHIEKQMIKNHGKNKTCCETPATTCYRKMCLRLLKCLIQSLKERHPVELSHLCSYHGKTAFLHSLCRRCLDSHWQGRLDRCFMRLLDDFITHVEKADLPHFFISKCNLFSPRCFPKRSLELLREELLEQRRLGLTVFQLPCAEEEPALIPAAPAPQQALSNTVLFGILLLLGVFLAAVASLPLQGPV
ncbi:cyclic GMP-AMP synthase-like isoform X1 [Acipenser ruthenus]|uniref:cyclic GMP-AMP synthase-like isoform X1 n=1 Tax=Acipenser ruthenus TaxID=7906 RepID=UPI002740E308|nr:cyclic GMP-AMP synthase-like isoform X1 [Acipenser ruthenus]